MSAPLYFITMVCLTILLNLALSGYNAVILRRIIDGTKLPQDTTQDQQASKGTCACRRMALVFGTALAAFLRIGLTLILSDLLVFPFVKIAAGLLLLWTSWSFFRFLLRSLSSHDAEPHTSQSSSMSEAILKIIIADLALGLDNILVIACVSIHHHAILITGLGISILGITIGAMVAPSFLLRLRWLGWIGLVIMIGLSLHLLIHGFQNAHFIAFH